MASASNSEDAKPVKPDLDNGAKAEYSLDMRDAHNTELIQKYGMLAECPARPNVIQLLEDFVKCFGSVIVNEWYDKVMVISAPLDLSMKGGHSSSTLTSLTTLAEHRLCEQIPERTNPYPPHIMNQRLPVSLVPTYQKLIEVQWVVAQIRDLFDAVCGLKLLFEQERVQFQRLKPLRPGLLLETEPPLVAREELQPSTHGTIRTFDEYRTEFMQRLEDWRLTSQPNYDDGVRVTAPSTVYGVIHLQRMIACDMFPTYIAVVLMPREVQNLTLQYYEKLKAYLLTRPHEARLVPIAVALASLPPEDSPAGKPAPAEEPESESDVDVEIEDDEEEILDV